MRSSAHTRLHKPQASDMILLSPPMIFSVVRALKAVSYVKRQKKTCCCPAYSNQSLAVSECT